ncbi:MAG: UvrD-helicase domain-containing protein [Deltaproteobacteria bacterium]|nr:UvrD-helicase domain-containing protein [Deltaproteobacteria bacterium]
MTARSPIRRFDPGTLPLTGTSFLEASAGTGKTYALATLYLRLLVERDLRPAEILVVTFTQAATAELRERIRARIREAIAATTDAAVAAKLRRALRDFDEAAIFTIHGFCRRTIQESAFESGLAFEPEFVEKPEIWQRTLAHDLWKQLLETVDPVFREWLAAGAGSSWEFQPDALFDWIAHRIGGDEEMPIEPAIVDLALPESPEPLIAASLRAWQRFAEIWSARRDAILELLCTKTNGLNKGKYKPASIRGRWTTELDLLARRILLASGGRGRAIASLPDFFAKYLTPQKIVENANGGATPLHDEFFEACGDVVAAGEALDRDFALRALALRGRFVGAVRDAARVRREAQHVLFFDDLLIQLRAAVRGEGGEALRRTLRTRHRVALIDEFQDTDAVQYEIFDTVWGDPAVEAEGGGLVLIGDPKQAIYAFRGADVYTYLAARARAGDAVYSLDVNYRSDPPVLDAVNALFTTTERPFAVDAIGYRPVEPAPPELRKPLVAADRFRIGLRVLFCRAEALGAMQRADAEAEDEPDEESEAGSAGKAGEPELPVRFGRTAGMRAMARDVAELLESGATIDGNPISPAHVAILARRKVELEAARRALETLGIPCVSRGEGNVFDEREAWELATVLEAWLAPGDPTRLRTALSSGAHGLDAAAIAALDDDSSSLAAIAERYAEYGRLWSEQGFARAFETCRAREGVTETLLGFGDGDRRLTNWLHLAELLARIAGERGASRTGLRAWLERAIADETTRLELGGDASLLRLERDDEAVSLVTLHGSKGLEYEFVYLPSLWESFELREKKAKAVEQGGGRRPVLYHEASSHRRTLDLGRLEDDVYRAHVDAEKAEASAEHLRLLYVGLTRARRQCVVLWGRIGAAHAQSPLARLVLGKHAAAAGIASDGFADWARRLGDEDWIAAWSGLVEAAPSAAAATGTATRVEDANLAPRDRWRPSRKEPRPLELEAPRPLAFRPLVTTSFSGLVRGSRRAAGYGTTAGPLATGRDLDAEVGLRPTPEDDAPDLALDMHLFPRGAEAGTVLHDVLERVDFGALDPAAVRRLAEQTVERSPLAADVVAKIEHVVRSVARTPLRDGPRPLRLADVPRARFVPELEFTLAAPGDAAGRGLSAEALARILAGAPAGSPLERYAERARSLAWPVLSGFLRGFIDGVFFDGERYALLDYKSNHLGTRRRDYLPDRLLEPMIEHDYVLQYLLYTVAVDRHLATRIADYDYERHFGGAYYLFLRGMAEVHPPGCGVFFDRPDAETVRRVSALIGHGEEGKA